MTQVSGGILLVHPKIREWAKPCNVPLGIAYTSAALKHAEPGWHVQVHDDNMPRWSDGQIRALIERHDFHLVGISAICHQYTQVKRWVKIVREVRPQQRIVIGGPISVLGDKLASWLDALVWQGESETDLPGLVRSGVLPVRGVFASPRSCDDLDSLPLPDWGAFDMEAYAVAPLGWVNKNKWAGGEASESVPRSMNVLASRGCPFKCRFCAHDFLHAGYRQRTPGNVIEELRTLKRRYRVTYFHLSDDNTMASLAWLRDFCRAFAMSPDLQDCHWGCAGRADRAEVGTLRMMYQARCRIVGIGVESGSQRVLDTMNKRVSVEENEQAILNVKEVFGSANYSLMVGTPGETDRDIDETIEMCRRTETRPEVVFIATPLPGTEWYDYALAKGLIGDQEQYLLKLDENARVINCNISGQSENWVWGAKARIERALESYGGAI